MRLLGIEFHDFGSFERQFVRLPEGLVLLVGKNNAGKTAILRGLAALASLPIREHRPLAISVGAYCRKRSPHPNYRFDLIYALEAQDLRAFCDADDDWSAKMLQEKPYLKFSFEVWPSQGLIGWKDATFHVWAHPEDPAVPILKFGGAPESLQYATITEAGQPKLGNLKAIQHLPYSGPVGQLPDGRQSVIVQQNHPLIKPLSELRDTKLVSAHRVPHLQMALASITELPSDANVLPGYLQTLQNNARAKFEKIEAFLTSVFPEFRYINPSNRDNQVAITLTDRATGEDIPLSHCGTGVEQLLSLATFAMTSSRDCLLLMDEPHSFLHPSAERELVRFINENSKKHFVVSTHSAILINSVGPDRINYLQSPGTGFTFSSGSSAEISRILFELGYRNSDVLFNDVLIAVEGESDKEILRILLRNHPDLTQGVIDRTGFPVMEGAGDGARALQTAVLRFEKLLDAIGRAKQKRIYLFDGDKSGDDRKLLSGTTASNVAAKIKFLRRLELENYLLCPGAVAQALKEQATLDEIKLDGIGAAEVTEEIKQQLKADDEKLFPRGKTGNPLETCKGSVLLQRLFAAFGNQRYEKRRSGVLIARLIDPKQHHDILDIVGLVKDLF